MRFLFGPFWYRYADLGPDLAGRVPLLTIRSLIFVIHAFV